jgi:hypothetical protein
MDFAREYKGADAPLIACQQNQGQASHPTLAAGMRVRACWDEAGNHVVRD